MPIRIRILLLGLVAILCVFALVLSKYFEINNHVAFLKHQQKNIELSFQSSSLIHSTPKERGISAGYLVDG